MKTKFNIYYTEEPKRRWIGGDLVTVGTFNRVRFAQSEDQKIYLSDQNTINGKVTQKAEDYKQIIERCYPHLNPVCELIKLN